MAFFAVVQEFLLEFQEQQGPGTSLINTRTGLWDSSGGLALFSPQLPARLETLRYSREDLPSCVFPISVLATFA